jgi:predicted phage terminase large subunit-like protein
MANMSMSGEGPDWRKVLEHLEPKKPLYCPHEPHPKQKAFLRSETLEALFGGAASGGKSDALLMAALQYVDTPGYAAFIFRNTFADLALPGAIMDRAREWLNEYPEVKWQSKSNTAIFPSGATLSFGYLDGVDDYLRYKGMEVQYIGFDEVTEIREQHYRYLISRLRKPSVGSGLALAHVPLRVRSASNPAPNWVRRYFVEEGKKKGRLFIPCGFEENPYVNQEAYGEALDRLSDVDRARLKLGDWYAEETGNFFDRGDFKIIPPDEVPHTAFMNTVRYWDLAATEKSEHNPDPDFTVGAKIAIVDGYMFVLDIRRFRKNAAGVEMMVRQTAEEDGPNVKIRMDQDPGQAGKAQVSHYARHVLLGFDFDGNPVPKSNSANVSAKVSRVNNWLPKVKRSEVFLVRGDWVTDFLDEAVGFGSSTGLHDDQMDAVSGGFEVLTGIKGKHKATVKLIV